MFLSAIALDEKSERYYSGGFEKSFKRKHLGAGLSSAGDLKISAGGDLTLLGSSIHTDSQADIDVDGNINVVHVLDEDYYDKPNYDNRGRPTKQRNYRRTPGP